MVQNTLGIMLSYYRKKYRFSQAQVCDGICSAATLSRVEAGNNEIDSLMSQRLLGRLGKEITQFEIILNDEDYTCWMLRTKIEGFLKEKNYEKADDLLEEYKKLTSEKHHLHQQFYLFQKAKLQREAGGSSEEVCEKLSVSLSLTKPDLENTDKQLYNMSEIEHILLLMKLDYKGWKGKDFEAELLKLIRYVEYVYSDKQREKTVIALYLHLLEWEERLGADRKVIWYADKAIALLAQQRSIHGVAEIHFKKAKAIERYYKNKNSWAAEEKNCKRECCMSYAIYDIMGKEPEKQEVIQFCEEKLQWQIIKQGILSE